VDSPSSLAEIREIADEAMRPVVGGFESVALVGFPDHSNVGDSAIWLGELAYLKARSVKVAYSCSSVSYRKENLERHTDDETPIVIHGGGYFGDIWRDPFDFMLRMVEDFPNRSIVVMPQTIHFESPPQLERARRVINGHRAMTICVRDHRSAQLAKQHFDHPAVLTPDSAVFLDLHTAAADAGILYLLREDREARAERTAINGEGTRRTDWVDLPLPSMPARVRPALLHRAKSRLQERIGGSNSAAWQERFAAIARDALAKYRLERGVHLLATAQIVVTDRIHAHILSLLMGLPHILVDNSYGKNRVYYEAWSQGLPLVSWASHLDDAAAIVDTELWKTR